VAKRPLSVPNAQLEDLKKNQIDSSITSQPGPELSKIHSDCIEDIAATLMAGGHDAAEAAGTPEPVEKGFATLNTLRYVAINPAYRKVFGD
jgi:hypothetical protein